MDAPLSPIPASSETPVTQVSVLFQKEYRMPGFCACCGATPAGKSRMWHPVVTDPVTHRITLHYFPLCTRCNRTVNEMFGMSSPLLLASLGLAIFFIILLFSGEFGLGVGILVIGGVTLAIIRKIQASRIGKDPNHLYWKVMKAVSSKALDSAHVTFLFTNKEFATQFATLNSGQLV